MGEYKFQFAQTVGPKSRYVFPALEVTSQNVFTEREKCFNGFFFFGCCLGAELNI